MKLHRINALVLKHVYISFSRGDRLFDIIYWPIIDLLVWGFTSAFIEKATEFNVMSMLLGGIILWMFVWKASQDMAIYVLEDFWSRSLYHVFSSPLKLSEHITAIVISGFIRAFMSFVLMILAAWVIYSYNIFLIPPSFLAIAVFLLSLFGWAVGMFVTSLILWFGKRVQVMAWGLVWLIQPFGCVLYPLSSLPAWAYPIAKYVPMTYIFENLRNAIAGLPIDYGQLLWAFAIEVALLLAMALLLGKAFRKAKETGLLATAT